MSFASFLKKLQGQTSGTQQPAVKTTDKLNAQPPRTVVRIEFDSMLKGSVYERPGGKVRQYGVTVDGATKVVTSGDFVERDTYEALLKAGAIRPRTEAPAPETPAPPMKRRQAS